MLQVVFWVSPSQVDCHLIPAQASHPDSVAARPTLPLAILRLLWPSCGTGLHSPVPDGRCERSLPTLLQVEFLLSSVQTSLPYTCSIMPP